MANRSKNKGDNFERKALVFFIEHAAAQQLTLVNRPERELGAGRREDKGDLKVLPDCAVQVKAWDDISAAIAAAVADAERQKVFREVPLGVGMVPVMRARATAVNWIFCAATWPTLPPDDSYLATGMVSRAVAHARDDKAGIPRQLRLAKVTRSGRPDVWVGTFEAWALAYRSAHEVLAPAA